MSQETFEILVHELLKSYGAICIRKRKHPVWKLPDGRKWVTPATASCAAAWQNNYNDLRARLGLKASNKTQADFEHRKKEERVEKHQDNHNYLDEKPTHEVLPAPPPAPNKRQRELMTEYRLAVERQAELEKTQLPKEQVFKILNHAPIVRRPGSGHHPGNHHSKAYTFSKEDMDHATFLLNTEGEAASKKYLDNIRFGVKHQIEKKEEEPTKMTSLPEVSVPVITAGSMQELLEQYKHKVRSYKKQIADAEIELARWQKVVEQLEAAQSTAIAAKETIKEMTTQVEAHQSPSNGNGAGKLQKPRGFWARAVTEVIGTSPISLDNKTLVDELLKVVQCSRSAAYQAVYQLKHTGFIYVDEQGFLRLRPQLLPKED